MPDRMVEREEDPAPRLSICSGRPSWRPSESSTRVRRDHRNRRYASGDRHSGESDHGDELAPAARAPAGDGEGRHEDGRVELHRDPDPDHNRAPPQTAGQREEECADDERRRDKIEPRQDHPAEEKRDERDDGEREPSLGRSSDGASVQGRGEQEHAHRTDNRHLGGEHDAVRGD